jgi:hypothetical protein
MKISELFENELSVPKSIKGWLAMGDQDGVTANIEGIFVFESKADAKKFYKDLDKELHESDAYAAEGVVDQNFIVFHCDHRVDEDDLSPIMFDTSKLELMKRLKASIAAGDIYGVSSFDEVKDSVEILRTN